MVTTHYLQRFHISKQVFTAFFSEASRVWQNKVRKKIGWPLSGFSTFLMKSGTRDGGK